jgi:hypothetical protein
VPLAGGATFQEAAHMGLDGGVARSGTRRAVVSGRGPRLQRDGTPTLGTRAHRFLDGAATRFARRPRRARRRREPPTR